MKKNNRGFMLAEVFIISSFVLGILVYMFVQINSIMRNYNRSFSYDTVSGLYITNEIKKYIKIIDSDNSISSVACTNNIYLDAPIPDDLKKNANVKNVIIGDINYLKENVTKDNRVTAKAADFIKYLENNNKCIIVVEFNDDTYASLDM